ncbi:BCCT family transporter [Malaciobacter marinus]|uniref:BCCT (Betaine/carnitine/choline) family transporter n=1 Tax=Malaciobacter marinus TaxID=505249 RepID=A0A347THK1_9BACT|nr:BCCT family transporter [Malaciobacter marinus]AXX86079.1 BCCT (betaine/carnitine/choline) family transporter [Malaciobacter marinus]PHO11721.1 BCCT transporter [Malaciobacter marinus]PHO14336.1 BCCT transporter [Malaciobacter marinus]
MDVNKQNLQNTEKIDKITLLFSTLFLVSFVLISFIDAKLLSTLVNDGFAWSSKVFGAYWQVLLLLTFLIGVYLAFSKTGSVILGKLNNPEMSTFQWIAIILCTLLAGGGVFWAAGEPIAHFITPPPIFEQTDSNFQKAINALSQSFVHWGFLAWAILGTLTSIVLMYLHYEKGLPLKPRTLLYFVFKEKVIHGKFGSIVDGFCIIAVAAGTIGPIGFLGLQISYSLHELFDIPNSFLTQSSIIVFAIIVYTLSALSGLTKGIQILSRYNVYLALFLVAFIIILGPTNFIINSYIQGVGNMINNFIPIATYRADTSWLGWWTVFFWGWFIGYGPMMAIFIARISRGRSIKELILAVSFIAPLVTMFWFTIVGGAGLSYEIAEPGVISEAFKGFNLPAALLAITQNLPFPLIISILFLVLTTIFIITTGDSMTYTMSVVVSGSTEPNAYLRVFWGVLMGALAIILISVGSGGITALQSFIVITAVPVSLILLPSLFNSITVAKKMHKEQGLS